MAEAVKKELGIESEMIEGAGGIFDVKVDGDLIYSKQETGEFPEHRLIIEKVAALTKAK